MIATIDGPAGAGKSTVAKTLARELGWSYLDSGALYRAITLKALRSRVEMTDTDALCRVAESAAIDLVADADGTRVLLDGADVSAAIRTPEITAQVCHVASCAEVRQAIIPLQRRFAETNDLVAEGRDMGTVVFPDADSKFYLDASAEERARRRHAELQSRGIERTLGQVLADMSTRDGRDRTRATAPLRRADDAVVVDTTGLPVEQVVLLLRNHIENQTV